MNLRSWEAVCKAEGREDKKKQLPCANYRGNSGGTIPAAFLPIFLHYCNGGRSPHYLTHFSSLPAVVMGVMMSAIYSWNSVKGPADE